MLIKVVSCNFFQTRSKILVKELNFRKAVSSVRLAVNYLTNIFHGYWLQFSIHTPLFQSIFFRFFLSFFLFILFPLKAFKTDFLINIHSFSPLPKIGRGRSLWGRGDVSKKGREIVKLGKMENFWKGKKCFIENYKI